MNPVLSASIAAALTGIFSIVGVILGLRIQAGANRAARAQQETREDQFRLFDARRDAYVAYLLAMGEARDRMRQARDVAETGARHAAAAKARDELWRAFAPVRLLATHEVADAGGKVLNYFSDARDRLDEYDFDAYDSFFRAYVRAARRDLTRIESEEV